MFLSYGLLKMEGSFQAGIFLRIRSRLIGTSTRFLFNSRVSKTPDVLYFYSEMRPDYAHKIFPDFRNHFFLLMETLAMMSVSRRGLSENRQV